MAGAVQPCRPVPGALYPSGTEIVFPRILGYRLAFGVVIERTSFSFRCRSPSGGEVQNRGPAGPLVCVVQEGVLKKKSLREYDIRPYGIMEVRQH